MLPSSDHIGVGVVLQDDQGRICATLAKPFEGIFSLLLAQLLALREGLKAGLGAGRCSCGCRI